MNPKPTRERRKLEAKLDRVNQQENKKNPFKSWFHNQRSFMW